MGRTMGSTLSPMSRTEPYITAGLIALSTTMGTINDNTFSLAACIRLTGQESERSILPVWI